MEMKTEDKFKEIILNCEGLKFREWEAIKKAIDMRFNAIRSKNTLTVDESILKNVTVDIN